MEINYYKKYLKYKNKYNILKEQSGGLTWERYFPTLPNLGFPNIVSIGFEFEYPNVIAFKPVLPRQRTGVVLTMADIMKLKPINYRPLLLYKDGKRDNINIIPYIREKRQQLIQSEFLFTGDTNSDNFLYNVSSKILSSKLELHIAFDSVDYAIDLPETCYQQDRDGLKMSCFDNLEIIITLNKLTLNTFLNKLVKSSEPILTINSPELFRDVVTNIEEYLEHFLLTNYKFFSNGPRFDHIYFNADVINERSGRKTFEKMSLTGDAQKWSLFVPQTPNIILPILLSSNRRLTNFIQITVGIEYTQIKQLFAFFCKDGSKEANYFVWTNNLYERYKNEIINESFYRIVPTQILILKTVLILKLYYAITDVFYILYLIKKNIEELIETLKPYKKHASLTDYQLSKRRLDSVVGSQNETIIKEKIKLLNDCVFFQIMIYIYKEGGPSYLDNIYVKIEYGIEMLKKCTDYYRNFMTNYTDVIFNNKQMPEPVWGRTDVSTNHLKRIEKSKLNIDRYNIHPSEHEFLSQPNNYHPFQYINIKSDYVSDDGYITTALSDKIQSTIQIRHSLYTILRTHITPDVLILFITSLKLVLEPRENSHICIIMRLICKVLLFNCDFDIHGLDSYSIKEVNYDVLSNDLCKSRVKQIEYVDNVLLFEIRNGTIYGKRGMASASASASAASATATAETASIRSGAGGPSPETDIEKLERSYSVLGMEPLGGPKGGPLERSLTFM